MTPHARALIAWLDTSFDALIGPDQAQALRDIERRYPELLDALEQALREPRPDDAFALAGLLGARFGWMRGRAAETASACLRALALEGGQEKNRALAHEGAAASLFALGDFPLAAEHAERSYWLHLSLRLTPGLLRAINLRGQIAREQGDLALAEGLHREVLDLTREPSPEPWAESMALGHLGVLAARSGKRDEAAALHRQALEIRERIGDVRGVASSLANLASLAREAGDTSGAAALLTRVLDLRASLQDDWGAANACYNLARLRLLQGDAAGARQGALDALRRSGALGDRLGRAEALELLAHIHTSQGATVEASAALDEALALRREAGAEILPETRALAAKLSAPEGPPTGSSGCR